MNNVIPLDADRRAEMYMDDYRAAATQYLNQPTPDGYMMARNAFARWVRDYVGGDEAELLVLNFDLGQRNEQGMRA